LFQVFQIVHVDVHCINGNHFISPGCQGNQGPGRENALPFKVMDSLQVANKIFTAEGYGHHPF